MEWKINKWESCVIGQGEAQWRMNSRTQHLHLQGGVSLVALLSLIINTNYLPQRASSWGWEREPTATAKSTSRFPSRRGWLSTMSGRWPCPWEPSTPSLCKWDLIIGLNSTLDSKYLPSSLFAPFRWRRLVAGVNQLLQYVQTLTESGQERMVWQNTQRC